MLLALPAQPGGDLLELGAAQDLRPLVVWAALDLAHELVPGDRRGADLGHLEPRRRVGELGCELQVGTLEERGGEDRDHRVAGAGDVVDLARGRRDVDRRALGAEQRHPVLSPGDQERRAADLVQHLGAGVNDLVLVPRRDPGRRLELLAVRGHDVEAEVARVVGPLGIGEDRLALRLGVAARGGQDLARQHTLAVVAADDAVHVGEALGDPLDEQLLQLVADPLTLLAIDAQDLLRVGDDPQLRCRRSLAVREHVVGVNALLLQEGAQAGTLGVLAHDAGEPHFAAQRDEVLRDVRGTAQPVVVGHPFEHLHGCLGRDALDVPIDVLVEHQVADDQHSGAPQALERAPEVVAARGHAAPPFEARCFSTSSQRMCPMVMWHS